MKKFIREYSAYNLWANERLCNVTAFLNDAQFNQEIISSFPSIQKTLLHIWDTQSIWIERLKGNSPTSFPSSDFSGTRQEVLEGVIRSSVELEEMAYFHGKKDLRQRKSYATLKGGKYTSAVYQVFVHVFNHSTYHRGQLVTMFRQAGVNDLPQTDLIYFYREIKA